MLSIRNLFIVLLQFMNPSFSVKYLNNVNVMFSVKDLNNLLVIISISEPLSRKFKFQRNDISQYTYLMIIICTNKDASNALRVYTIYFHC